MRIELINVEVSLERTFHNNSEYWIFKNQSYVLEHSQTQCNGPITKFMTIIDNSFFIQQGLEVYL